MDALSGFLAANGDAHGRPVGVAIAKDGALLVADDVGEYGVARHALGPNRRPERPQLNEGSDHGKREGGPSEITVSREKLADLLNEDLEREYQAVIAYVVYSQVLKGAEYMNIPAQLETHAQQELKHALTISRQIDYLGKMPSVKPKPVKVSDKPREMLGFDLDNENETIRNYRTRVRQCEALGEYALAEQIREILVEEQDHQIDLATALGIEVPNILASSIGSPPSRLALLVPILRPHPLRRDRGGALGLDPVARPAGTIG